MKSHRKTFVRFTQIALAIIVVVGLVAGNVSAQEQQADQSRWVLLSDTHILADRTTPHSKVFPADLFEEAVKQYTQLQPRIAGVIITGDCAGLTGRPDDYKVLREISQPLRDKNIPLHCVMGNHDSRDNYRMEFPEYKPGADALEIGKKVALIETPHVNLILLDSMLWTNHTTGGLGTDQLRWLADTLDKHPDKPAILFAHHPPHFNRKPGEKTGALQDTDALLDVIRDRKQVKAYVYGHSHAWGSNTTDGISYVNLPALGWLFDDSPRGWVEMKLSPEGADFILHTLDTEDQRDGDTVRVEWEPVAATAEAL